MTEKLYNLSLRKADYDVLREALARMPGAGYVREVVAKEVEVVDFPGSDGMVDALVGVIRRLRDGLVTWSCGGDIPVPCREAFDEACVILNAPKFSNLGQPQASPPNEQKSARRFGAAAGSVLYYDDSEDELPGSRMNRILEEWNTMLRQNPQLRRGQAFFNALSELEPPLAEVLRGGFLDPFYKDERVDNTIAYVRRILEGASSASSTKSHPYKGPRVRVHEGETRHIAVPENDPIEEILNDARELLGSLKVPPGVLPRLTWVVERIEAEETRRESLVAENREKWGRLESEVNTLLEAAKKIPGPDPTKGVSLEQISRDLKRLFAGDFSAPQLHETVVTPSSKLRDGWRWTSPTEASEENTGRFVCISEKNDVAIGVDNTAGFEAGSAPIDVVRAVLGSQQCPQCHETARLVCPNPACEQREYLDAEEPNHG